MTGMLAGWRAGLLGLLFLSLGPAYPAAGAQLPQVAQEYDLKAAFLFNLVKFVRWPAPKFQGEASPLLIGVRGADAGDRFERLLRNKLIDKRQVIVQPLERIEQVKACHVLFISRAENNGAAEWIEAGKAAAVLTVGETQEFLDQGGMIQFAIESEQLRLEINEQCARQAGLNIMANALSTLVNKGIAKVRNF